MLVEFEGGPYAGGSCVVDEPGPAKVLIVHGNCGCGWCDEVEGAVVEHVYERRRHDGVYSFRRSRLPERLGA
ncbi:MAG TPA: hypothetical protein VG265_07345 [Gaiellaceae bacterium]|jgi:hypothetical protein|nr:hypothetical protein [Gaiellaceae bacterium]